MTKQHRPPTGPPGEAYSADAPAVDAVIAARTAAREAAFLVPHLRPGMRFDAALGGGPDWAGYALIGDALRTLKPLLPRFGIATGAEVDSYEERLRAEAVDHGVVIMVAPLVSAWARKP